MKRYSVAAACFLLLPLLVFAQQLSPSVVYAPGDTLRIHLSFKQSPSPVLRAIRCNFVRAGGPLSYYSGFSGAFSLMTVTPLSATSATEYEVSGQIPEFAASGTYRREEIVLESLGKKYAGSADFPALTIEVKNPRQTQYAN